MRRKVLLSSLAVGRCFTLAIEPGGATDEDEKKRTDPILSPKDAWKVIGEGDGGLEAQSASGETKSFEGETKVVEIPRQGYDKLVARAAGA